MMSVILAFAASSLGSNDHTWFVAPQGNDTWSGRRDGANAQATDGPLRSIERARDLVREWRLAGGTGTATVRLRGKQFLASPFLLGPEDSNSLYTGDSQAGERPELTGGREISGWQDALVNGMHVLVADLPEVKSQGWWFRELWVNGERRPRTRLPAEGWFRIAELPDVAASTPWHEGQRRFRFADGDLAAWSHTGDIEVVALHFWVESRLPVAGIDPIDHMVTFARRSVFRLTDDHAMTPGRYYVENVLEALARPGEWYLDRAQGRVHYVPKAGESAATLHAIAPRLAQLVRLEGDPEHGRFVERVQFVNIDFAHCEWSPPENRGTGWPADDVAGAPQAAVNVPGAMFLEACHDCALIDCRVTHVGGYGIEIARACTGNRVVDCEVSDLGGGGIKIGTTQLASDAWLRTGGNEVANTIIARGGRIYHSAVGLWIGHSDGNHIAHDRIEDFYYTGLSIGWSWGYGQSGAHHNHIEFNDVAHIGQGWLSDMGGIYTLGVSPGTMINDNVFRDIESHGYGGWGIYFDEGSTGIVAQNNLVHHTKSSGFHQHYGKDNVVRNNIFAFCGESSIARSRAEPHRSFTFEHNIVVMNQGTLLSGDWSGDQYRLDHNVYFDTRGAVPPFDRYSFAQWQQRGQDQHSLVTDPRFVNAAALDFRLAPESPARALGFIGFDPRRAGVAKH